jgi:hypothetical protein
VNSYKSHRVGRTGEIGVEVWAQSLGVDVQSFFRDENLEDACDLMLAGWMVEVKSWSGGWDHYGRCIRPGQLSALKAKAEVVLWTTVTLPKVVTLRGYSTVDEIAARPVVTLTHGDRSLTQHQVPEDALHDVEELL